MKIRIHKKYKKSGIQKSRRNKVGGFNSFIESFTNAIGLTTPQVIPLQQVVPIQPVAQQVVEEEKPYFPGQVNKKKENMLQKVGGKRTRKYKK